MYNILECAHMRPHMRPDMRVIRGVLVSSVTLSFHRILHTFSDARFKITLPRSFLFPPQDDQEFSPFCLYLSFYFCSGYLPKYHQEEDPNSLSAFFSYCAIALKRSESGTSNNNLLKNECFNRNV